MVNRRWRIEDGGWLASVAAGARELPSSILHPLRRCVRYRPLLVIACTLLLGCADKNGPTTRPLSVRERQEQALRDPFAYGPEEQMPGVSGQQRGRDGERQPDRGGIKGDWDRFWNP